MVVTTVSPEIDRDINLAVATRIVLVVEYDGTGYHGLQLQSGLPTIQGELEKALLRLTGVRTRVSAASRTDTGVHARGQVVSFRTGSHLSLRAFVNGLNHYLPDDIAVKESHRVRNSFDIRRDAVSREYSYHILNSGVRSPLAEGLAYRVVGHLDVDAMNQVCQALIGRHDFASFASGISEQVRSTVRHVHHAEVRRDGEQVVFNVAAGSFLAHQVRNTVGALIKIGRGKISDKQFCDIIEAKKPGLAGPAAPACGLYLTKVTYPRPFEEEI